MQVISRQRLTRLKHSQEQTVSHIELLEAAIVNCWSKIAPFWPLKNLIAVNPMAGFEDLPFHEALRQGSAFFQQLDLPVEMRHVNRESIKWLQAYFDEGQSTIQMPLRELGLLKSLLLLIPFDLRILESNQEKLDWLQKIPHDPLQLIQHCLTSLDISIDDWETFLTLMLTTLPGWASHVQYRATWTDSQDSQKLPTVTQMDYLAARLVFTCLMWPNAKELLSWHSHAMEKADVILELKQISVLESDYIKTLLKKLKRSTKPMDTKSPDAQLIFCIDVRSEPFRRSIESTGDYETLGFAGFFGIPVTIDNPVTGESYASCPVLLKPRCQSSVVSDKFRQAYQRGYTRSNVIKKLYQSTKYTFASPYSLVETIGFGSGIWMGMKCFAPTLGSAIKSRLKKIIAPTCSETPSIESIPFDQQVEYGFGALKMMGLTDHFAPLVVICGHGSTSKNNAYATALDCGACGGHRGAPNARILAMILNRSHVRDAIRNMGIEIPVQTHFIAAEHNTTTDEVVLFDGQVPVDFEQRVSKLKKDLDISRHDNSLRRALTLGVNTKMDQAKKETVLRSQDWAQVRPEWGLANNSAFIVAPRWYTSNIDLEGRAFLHSYDWEQDADLSILSAILTAPMVVAQWINAQYLFSALDNISYGGGSKVTKNITGKIGVMQGNASDLMHGLPLQSVRKSDDEAYHQPIRLTVVVYAPVSYFEPIICGHGILRKLIGNEWVHLICHDPESGKYYQMDSKLLRCFQPIPNLK